MHHLMLLYPKVVMVLIFTENWVHTEVLLFSRFETIETNPDIILGNDFARVGILKNQLYSEVIVKY